MQRSHASEEIRHRADQIAAVTGEIPQLRRVLQLIREHPPRAGVQIVAVQCQNLQAVEADEAIGRNGVELVVIQIRVLQSREPAQRRDRPAEPVVLEAQVSEGGELVEVRGEGAREADLLDLNLRHPVAGAEHVLPLGAARVAVAAARRPLEQLRVAEPVPELLQDGQVARVRDAGDRREERERDGEEQLAGAAAAEAVTFPHEAERGRDPPSADELQCGEEEEEEQWRFRRRRGITGFRSRRRHD